MCTLLLSWNALQAARVVAVGAVPALVPLLSASSRSCQVSHTLVLTPSLMVTFTWFTTSVGSLHLEPGLCYGFLETCILRCLQPATVAR
jgi:hypothetical protein